MHILALGIYYSMKEKTQLKGGPRGPVELAVQGLNETAAVT